MHFSFKAHVADTLLPLLYFHKNALFFSPKKTYLKQCVVVNLLFKTPPAVEMLLRALEITIVLSYKNVPAQKRNYINPHLFNPGLGLEMIDI